MLRTDLTSIVPPLLLPELLRSFSQFALIRELDY